MTREEFLQEIRETVMTLWADFQILPSIAAAQAAHESGNGQSDLAQNGNALFGIKVANGVCDGPGEPVSFDDPSWTGGVICHLTWEHIDGEDIQVYDTFRIYDSWGASIQDYADYLHVRGLYDAVIGETDYLSLHKRYLMQAMRPTLTMSSELLHSSKNINLPIGMKKR
ncbi:phage lysin [Geomicrobium sp. JCM 19037]|uniref:glycoside hydrolase family 73 protein n=1 Tax=Geomicrobium sp. JCM 19037 TaxID=1460634 RepID=UPI00045F44E0|nr:glucosaminidase domain-containing protein [Geomicrobium sp. JCM 19037]GAK04423.1 phage lysin [Geomicrobium sp. JCM 19037]